MYKTKPAHLMTMYLYLGCYSVTAQSLAACLSCKWHKMVVLAMADILWTVLNNQAGAAYCSHTALHTFCGLQT